MAFSYTAGGLDVVSQIRFAISDTQATGHTFEDEELTGAYAMPEAAGNVQLAGAYALESLAANKARLAIISKQGPDMKDMRTLSSEYREMAKALRDRAVIVPVVISPVAVFTLSQDGGITPGSMDVW